MTMPQRGNVITDFKRFDILLEYIVPEELRNLYLEGGAKGSDPIDTVD